MTGEFLLGKPFTATTWAREIGADGRPIVLNDDGSGGCLPDAWGSTNFNPPSYDPRLRLFFVSARETCATFHSEPPQYVPGQNTAGGVVWADRDKAFGALRALDVMTGDLKWEFRYPQPNLAGVMSTASGLVFTGDQEGNFIAFDSALGRRAVALPDRHFDLGCGRDDLHARRTAARADSVGLRVVLVRAAGELILAT